MKLLSISSASGADSPDIGQRPDRRAIATTEVAVTRWTIFKATERRMYERELVSARNLFETTLSSIGDGVITTDASAVCHVL